MTAFNPTPKRIAREMCTNNYSLSVEARDLLVQLGELYNATVSSALDELVRHAVPGIIEEKENMK